MDRPLYNQLATYYEQIEGRDWKSEINLIASILGRHKSRDIVDLGCGTGYHARALTILRFNTTGIDISKHNILLARRKAKEARITSRFIVGNYYTYRPSQKFDAALCLNWSIPVRNDEIQRFLNNTNALLQPEGLLIFDFERVSQIVWSDVGKPIVDSWDQKKQMIVRVSVGRIASSVLYSNDIYLIYPKPLERTGPPNEKLRYKAAQEAKQVQVFSDRSCVRFFSIPEIRHLARPAGFRMIGSFLLPRNKYRRNYVVLQKNE
jgi:SAM-dependent methyltransferase